MTEQLPTPEIEILKREQSGLYGVVWRGRQSTLGRDVAIKFIKPSMAGAKDAIAHAKSLAKISHPNVVTVHYVAQLIDPDTNALADCVVMEWLSGDRLDVRLAGARLPFDEAMKLCNDLLNGLEAIHAQGIAHGDLHCGNVMLCQNGPKIIDIDYAESESLARLSASSRDAHVSGDIDFVRYLLRRVLLHSDIRPDVASDLDSKINPAASIADLRRVLSEVSLAQKTPLPSPPLGDIPSVRRLDEMMVQGEQISGEAATLLFEAAQDPSGMIMLMRFLGGEKLQTHGRQFLEPGNPRSTAVWKAAIKELEMNDYIEHTNTGSGTDMYKVTGNGYDAADEIRRQIVASEAK